MKEHSIPPYGNRACKQSLVRQPMQSSYRTRISAFLRHFAFWSRHLLLFALATTAAAQQPPVSIPLWPSEPPHPPPGLSPNPQPERTDDQGTVFNVRMPTMAVHRPPREKANGMAFLVCPGGSYSKIGLFRTGMGSVEDYVPKGVAVIVLKYRTSPPVRSSHDAALADAKRALRLIRLHADEWGIDPNRIGIIGASAGGHLALNVITHADDGNPDAADPIERLSCRVAFAGLVCPWPGKTKQPMTDFPLGKAVPPMFITAARDDLIAPASFAEDIAAACEKADLQSRLWLVDKGGHRGFVHGAKTEGTQWFTRFYQWTIEHRFDQPTPKGTSR